MQGNYAFLIGCLVVVFGFGIVAKIAQKRPNSDTGRQWDDATGPWVDSAQVDGHHDAHDGGSGGG